MCHQDQNRGVMTDTHQLASTPYLPRSGMHGTNGHLPYAAAAAVPLFASWSKLLLLWSPCCCLLNCFTGLR
jgi:hypothetical protein